MRRRLAIFGAISVAVALLPMTGLFYLVLSHLLESDARDLLAARAAAAAATLTPGVTPTESVRPEPTEDAALDASTWVFDARGRLIERPPATGPADALALSLASVTHPTFRTVGGISTLALPLGVGGPASRGVVVAAVASLPYEHAERTALLAALALDAVVPLAVALLTWRVVGAALAPVSKLTIQAAEWGAHDVHRRFALGPAHDELTALATTLDGLLERLSNSLTHERRLTAEIAHELRTPLARIRAEAEVALRGRRTITTLRAALTDVSADAEQLAQTIDVLLCTAAAHSTPADQHSDPAQVLTQALDTARLLDPHTSVTGELSPEQAQLTVDTAHAGQILSPVLDNAVRYGRGIVTVKVHLQHNTVTFAIHDNGPGFRPEEIEAVFAPGVQGSAATPDTGVGLGLTLARRLARGAGGDITARPGTDGGTVHVTLPRQVDNRPTPSPAPP